VKTCHHSVIKRIKDDVQDDLMHNANLNLVTGPYIGVIKFSVEIKRRNCHLNDVHTCWC